jgi:hypothetical protein
LKGALNPDHWLEAILIKSGDLFADGATSLGEEMISAIAQTPEAKIERIVSTGQASPPAFGTIRIRRNGFS